METTIINQENWRNYKVIGIVKHLTEVKRDKDMADSDAVSIKLEYVFDCFVDDIVNIAIKNETITLDNSWRNKWKKDANNKPPSSYRHTFGTRKQGGFIALTREQELMGRYQRGEELTIEEKKELKAYLSKI